MTTLADPDTTMSGIATATRPPPASRGGRGFHGGRGWGRARSQHHDSIAVADDNNEDNGNDNDDDLSRLRRKHGDKLTSLQGVFSDWDDLSLLSALEEADGDEHQAALKISEGMPPFRVQAVRAVLCWLAYR